MPDVIFPLDSSEPFTDLLLGAAPIEGRFSGVVDVPNSCATVYVPTSIFDFDIEPSAGPVPHIDPGQGAPHSPR